MGLTGTRRIVIKFSEFCSHIYPSKAGIESKPSFVVKMFQSIGNEWASKCDDDDDYAKKLFSGSKPLTESIRMKTPNPFPLIDGYHFFKKHIHELKVADVFESFGFPETSSKNFDDLAAACALMLRDFCSYDEDLITDSIFDKYQEAQSNPYLFPKKVIDPGDIKYVTELFGVCPLCNKKATKLIIDYHNDSIKNYEIAHIYPDGLTFAKERELNAVKPKPHLSLIDCYENKIALCPFHYAEYSRNPTAEEYKKLLDAKEKAMAISSFKEEVDSSDIGDSIKNIIHYLTTSASFIETSDLREVAKKVEEKISADKEFLTLKEISSLASQSFKTIDSFMEENEAKYTDGSTELGRKIKKLSENLMSKGLTCSEVIENLTDEINNDLPVNLRNRIACRYLVAYFVAHCEVLTKNEVSE